MLYYKKIFKQVFTARGKYFYMNFKSIPTYFKLIWHLNKYGYDKYALWSTCYWFIDTMKDVLTRYNGDRMGYPCNMTEYEWDKTISRMIALLGDMDENNPEYDDLSLAEIYQRQQVAKNEFFALFSKYFYDLWD